MRCRHCDGPIVQGAGGLWLHDNRRGWYAGREMRCNAEPKGFPIGARVLVDGRDEAIVKQFFPEGSSSFLWPHYKLDFVGGDFNVVVSPARVGVERRGGGTDG